MNWKGHLKWGFITITAITILIIIDYFVYSEQFNNYIDIFGNSKFIIFGLIIPNVLIAYFVGLYASLFPDVDIGTSKAFSVTYMILIILTIYFAYTDYLLGLCTSLIIMALILSLKHRGIMHEWYTGIILGIMFMLLFSSVIIGIFFIVGYLTHLACDRRSFDD